MMWESKNALNDRVLGVLTGHNIPARSAGPCTARRGEAVVLYEYVEVCKEDKVNRGAVPSPLSQVCGAFLTSRG